MILFLNILGPTMNDLVLNILGPTINDLFLNIVGPTIVVKKSFFFLAEKIMFFVVF